MRQLAQKIIPVLISCVVIFLVYSSLDISQYRDHFSRENPFVQGEQTFLSDIDLVTDQKDELWMVKKIDTVQKRAWVSVYSFTLPSLREALLRAKNRGADVQVILEKSPFQTTTINRETRDFFLKNDIPLHESDAKQFSFMHAKYMIFDDAWTVETSNWTRASFAKNREFYMSGDDPAILSSLADIFQRDFAGGKGASSDVRLLAGPTNARERLIDFFSKSEKNIHIYAPSFSDKEMITALENVCRKGAQVQILLAYYADSESPDYDDCIQVRWMQKKPLHAKVIVRDESEAFVGSFNYTANSLENNREVGLFINGENISRIMSVFSSDWQSARVALAEK